MKAGIGNRALDLFAQAFWRIVEVLDADVPDSGATGRRDSVLTGACAWLGPDRL